MTLAAPNALPTNPTALPKGRARLTLAARGDGWKKPVRGRTLAKKK